MLELNNLPNPPVRCPAIFATPYAYSRLLAPILNFFPNGPREGINPYYAACEMVDAEIHVLKVVLEKLGSKVSVGIDAVELKNGFRKIKGFIIHVPGKTKIVPMTVIHNLVRLRGEPIFLFQKNAAAELLNAFLGELAGVMNSEVEAVE